jgi:hypothetical protein
MIPTTLVVGASSAEREQAIAHALAADQQSGTVRVGVLLEGLANGTAVLIPDEHLHVARIAAGCLCCSNNMIMRIYLNRLIQQKPHRLFLSLSNSAHLEQINAFLCSSGYEQILELTQVINLNLTNH